MNKIEKLPHIHFRHFCYTLGVVPSSYLDTMTDLELKLWLIKFLCEKVIPVVNNNSEAVKELQELFLKLQNYVNDYFENLDVQEEINNKLEEMAKTGELENLISIFVSQNTTLNFKTVSDMKKATNIVNGSFLKTSGFYDINDNGGAFYIATNENITSDEQFVIELQNNLYAKLIYTNTINLKSCGLKLDGITVETDKFQNVIDNNKINKIIVDPRHFINRPSKFTF